MGVALFYMLHTASGLARISSYLSGQLSLEIGQDVKVDVEAISLSLGAVNARMLVNDALRVEVHGDRGAFDRVYDVNYHIRGEKIAFEGVNFQDKVNLKGRFQGTLEAFKLQGKGRALDGKVDFSLQHQAKQDREIALKMQEGNATKLFQLFGKAPLIKGKFSLDMDVLQYSQFEKAGDIKLTLHRAGVYPQNIRHLYGIAVPDDLMLWGNLSVHLTNAIDHFDAKIASTIGKIFIKKGKITEAKQEMRALYSVEIPALSKWQFLTKKAFYGPFVANGEFLYHDGLRLDGQSKSLSGGLDYYYEKGTLEAKLDKVSLQKLFMTMHYPPIMIGDMSGRVELDIQKDVALVNLRSHNLHFKANAVLEKIRKASSIDIAKEIFTTSYFTSTIEKGIVYYDFKAENSASHIYLLDAKMDSHKNSIDTNFDVKMQGEELSGVVYGSLKYPQVKLDMSKYIKFKAQKELDDFFGTGTSGKIKKKLNDVKIDDVKGLLKKLF